MKQYHKIQTMFNRDPDNNFKSLLIGEWAKPEFEYLKDNSWIGTEKVDGMNIRVMWRANKVEFAGKTDAAMLPPKLIVQLEKLFPLEKMATLFDSCDACLYGEGYGAGIQKGGGLYRDVPGFVLFDVNIDEWWLERENVLDIAEKLNVPTVPVMFKGTLLEAIEYTKEGFASNIAEQDRQAEGLVLRPLIELKNRRGKRVITKIKLKDFPHA